MGGKKKLSLDFHLKIEGAIFYQNTLHSQKVVYFGSVALFVFVFVTAQSKDFLSIATASQVLPSDHVSGLQFTFWQVL